MNIGKKVLMSENFIGAASQLGGRLPLVFPEVLRFYSGACQKPSATLVEPMFHFSHQILWHLQLWPLKSHNSEHLSHTTLVLFDKTLIFFCKQKKNKKRHCTNFGFMHFFEILFKKL